jgi:hypothetical protein
MLEGRAYNCLNVGEKERKRDALIKNYASLYAEKEMMCKPFLQKKICMLVSSLSRLQISTLYPAEQRPIVLPYIEQPIIYALYIN